ncbi:response regulator transcription factor [Streptomyces niveus]|uniref:response regulator transcription factor n=1 Tax=Streptomyces niveus TaxID=193462 RepID=UPI00341593B2
MGDRVIRVLLVDDEWLVRAGLATMLSSVPDIEVVAQASDGAAVPEAVQRHRPDVVLMDLRMKKIDGITATAALRAQPHPPEVIILTTFDTDTSIVKALRAGASGFLVKDTPPAELVDAVHRVAAGEPILSPTVTRKLIRRAVEDHNETRDTARARLALLTPGELRIATAIGTGSSNAEIAAQLSMSIATIKSYGSRILTKLELNNRVQIALLVHDAGTET